MILDVYWKAGMIFGILSFVVTLLIPYLVYRCAKYFPEEFVQKLPIGFGCLIFVSVLFVISNNVDGGKFQLGLDVINFVVLPIGIMFVGAPFTNLGLESFDKQSSGIIKNE